MGLPQIEEEIKKWEPEYTNSELREFEKEVFSQGRKKFQEFLEFTGAWVVSRSYPNGAIHDVKLYEELNAKWSALNDLRYRTTMARNQELASLEKTI